MPASAIDRIPDPLVDRFGLDELVRIAPWVYDEINAVGVERIRDEISRMGHQPEQPQMMPTWVSAVRHCHSDLWNALAQG